MGRNFVASVEGVQHHFNNIPHAADAANAPDAPQLQRAPTHPVRERHCPPPTSLTPIGVSHTTFVEPSDPVRLLCWVNVGRITVQSRQLGFSRWHTARVGEPERVGDLERVRRVARLVRSVVVRFRPRPLRAHL